METLGLELMLLGLRMGKLAIRQLELVDLNSLPPEMRAELLTERDQLNASLARLDSLGR